VLELLDPVPVPPIVELLATLVDEDVPPLVVDPLERDAVDADVDEVDGPAVPLAAELRELPVKGPATPDPLEFDANEPVEPAVFSATGMPQPREPGQAASKQPARICGAVHFNAGLCSFPSRPSYTP
jgi:hypothetical protein